MGGEEDQGGERKLGKATVGAEYTYKQLHRNLLLLPDLKALQNVVRISTVLH